jgi:peptidoglycan pentaglycine glycine transferase (the first glycine)
MGFRMVPIEDAQLFDQFMAGTPNGHIFQSFAWGEVKKPQWEPLRVILEEEGQIVAAASILKRKIPMTGKCLFYLPRGPVLHDWHDKGLFTKFLGHLKGLAKAHGAILIKIDPCLTVEQKDAAKMLQAGGFMPTKEKYHFGGLQPRYTFRLGHQRRRG